MHDANHERALTQLHERLKERGHSRTGTRDIVFALLWQHEPQSMHELYQRAAARLDRASLYRVTALFEKLGIVRRVHIGWKYKLELSELFSDHHHHLTCVRCGRVAVISQDALEHFIHDIAADAGFTPQQHQVEIQGHCAACSVIKIAEA